MNFDDLTNEQKIQVAKGFDATPELIPFIPYLLQDLWALGSSPHLIIKILKSINLPETSKVIDLACGKGAVSCKIADELRFKVLGIDLFEPFIDHAKEKAKKLNVEQLCNFRVQDAATAVNTHKNFDVVILASAESLLGNIESTIISLRKCVRQNGYIIFDGSYLLDDAKIENPDYAVIKNYKSTVKALKSQGDEIVQEVFIAAEETKKVNDEYTKLIRIRAEELSIQHPDKENLFLSYVRKQEEECKIIENEIAGCIWCLKKN
jgi:cyclopropane fatty-acyl-phospholipid synthase-like methyltransferase